MHIHKGATHFFFFVVIKKKKSVFLGGEVGREIWTMLLVVLRTESTNSIHEKIVPYSPNASNNGFIVIKIQKYFEETVLFPLIFRHVGNKKSFLA